MPREVDVVVIGAGPVGENVADRARAAGLEVVIVERELVGGECSYWACVPSKTLLRSAAALRAAQRVPGAAEAVTGELDVAAVFRRRNAFVSDWSDQGGADWLDSVGIGLERGQGRLDGPRRVVVEHADGSRTTLVAKHAVAVATGSDAAMPAIDGLADARPWTSREATSAQEAPARLAVIGGGTVAVEMATAFAGFGSEVTVLARSGLLSAQEPFAGEAVAEGLRELGATVRLHTSPERVERNDDGATVITLPDGETIEADEVLVATGRTPRTRDLGLETVGLEPGEWIEVDDTLLVTGTRAGDGDGDWLYAVGDVTRRALLTHQGKYQARAAGDVIAARALGRPVDNAPWGVHVATADHAAVPSIVYSEPEVASVGLTEAAAREAGLAVRVVEVGLDAVSGTGIHSDGPAGRAKLVLDADRDVVVGATFVGQDVGELLQAATIAIVGEVPVRRLWHAVPAFPSVSEIWLRLLETLGRPEADA
ncbi:dihydrolipoyl dehydrogenase family protein [Agromyces aerolatus]|uniref:dihydrolipoyl dehydrogenase family protein n=1 Tax=Agromyces sp. LY-1074 TaxID=3074080 RepID=UPI002862A6A1|nr:MULTISPECIES: NAD(P)/FAD-dependent oxidoreductase [unclassified Agromyces]MDR5701818.1 NAD(P)/FAD-dependent oxidoreductase [Agromyces sp. LY-1074]MDR5707512.1 NAD(P)/FAD-dependent oxidoreductase [Agromyces sp. LY-1358]